jgi:hypothetical protein
MNQQYPFSRPDGFVESSLQKQQLTRQIMDVELQELIQLLNEA